jgi:hypothetical protein
VRVLALVLMALALVVSVPGPAIADTTVKGSPLRLLGRLVTQAERGAGYRRDLFRHWIDADGDGCDTRREVLIAESTAPLVVRAGCAFNGGAWVSAYDGTTTKNPSTFDIDHVVALKEAWDSGAHAWSAARRERFANDLGDPRSLRAVTASSNRSKSDRDPAEWLPPRTSLRCRYAKDWVVVKVRWRLSVDRSERRALRGVLEGCSARKLRVIVR